MLYPSHKLDAQLLHRLGSSGKPFALFFALTFIAAAGLSALLIYLLGLLPLPLLQPGSLQRDYVVAAIGSLLVVSLFFLLIRRLRDAEILLSPSERKFQAIMSQTPVGICIIDADTIRFVAANPAACQALGYTHDELVQLEVTEVIAPEDLRQQPLRFDYLRTGKLLHGERTFMRKDGSTFAAEVIVTMMDDGKFLGTFNDISERKLLENRLLEEKNFADSLIKSLPGVFYLFDDTGKFLRWNENMELVTGYSASEIAQLSPLDLIPMKDKEYVAQQIGEVFLSGSAVADSALLTKRGEEIPYFFTGVRARLNNVNCLVGAGIDITARRAAEQQIQFLAYYDALTGLPNRVLFGEQLNQALAAAQRNRQPLAILFIDLDFFKEVNDTYGHDCGDQILQQASSRISASLRSMDCVSRLGGDEFVAMLQGIASPEDAVLVAEKILAAIAAPFDLDGRRITLSSSIGIAIHPEHGDDAHSLISSADKAMYTAKSKGRNGCCLSPS